MSEDNPPPLPPRSIIRQHIPGHTDHGSALQQQDLQLWQHLSLSQSQPAAGIQAVPVGIGFANRPQQQLWADHSNAYSQRGWQPLPQPHTQQSPQESQDMSQQVVRSQHQNWPGEMNQLQLQQLQQLIFLQQQQQQQQIQQQLQQHPTEQPIHHMDPVNQHDEQVHDKFTKSPSPQIDDSRHSPVLSRQYIQNVTSPQQQMWPHHQMMHQYELQHNENQHSQAAFQHTPTVSHHQPLFTQQQYMQPLWQQSPYSQVQLPHLRQNTPQMQQHLLWQQQQQQQLHQHQLQQQQHQLQHNSDPPPPYSPPNTNHYNDKPSIPEKKELDFKNDQPNFLNNRLFSDQARNDRLKTFNPPVTTSNNVITPSAPPITQSVTNQSSSNITSTPVRILTKANHHGIPSQQNDSFNTSPQKPVSTNFSNSPVSSNPNNFSQRPLGMNNNHLRPQSFNPNPSSNPYQNLSPQNANKGFQGFYGNQNRFPSPTKDTGFNPVQNTNQFRPRSPGMRNSTPNIPLNSMFQRNNQTSYPGTNFQRPEGVEVHIFVQGLDPRTRAENLVNYFEVVGRPAAVKDQILFGLDHTEALVTFLQRPDFNKMKQNVRSRRLENHTLDICEVPLAKAIVVSSDVQVRTESLKYYFQRESVGGGPLKKEDGVDETEDGCVVLEFDDYRVVQRLCSGTRQHRVDNVLLRVSPYYQCENGAIWDTSLHVVPVPKPVNIQILPDQLEFVKRHCQSQFAARLRERHADISFSKDHVTVKCNLRQSMPNYRMLVRGWETGIQEGVAKFLGEHIDQADVDVPENVWDKLTEWMNGGKNEFKDFLVKLDRDKKHIKIVGMKGGLKNALQVLNQKINSFVRASRRKSETRRVKSVEKLDILEIQGTFVSVCKKYLDLKISRKGNEVTIGGDPDDIPNAFIEIYSECDRIEPVMYKHSKSREYVEFTKKEPTRKYIQRKLDNQLLKGAWNMTGTEVHVFTPKGGKNEEIKNVILESVREDSIQVDRTSTGLLNSEVWGDFLEDKKRRYKDKVEIFTKKLQVVAVVGTSDVVHTIVKQIGDFLDEKTVKTVTVACDPVTLEFISECWTDDDFAEIKKCDVVVKTKATGIELTGLSEKLIVGKQKLDMKLKRICSKKHQIRKTGIYEVIGSSKKSGNISDIERDCKCIIKLPQTLDDSSSSLLSDFEVIEMEDVEREISPVSGPKCFVTKKHKIKIRLVQGEIGLQKADIIVCSAASNLNLKSGSASYSLIKQGGPQLQNECTTKFPNGIKNGEVAVIDSGNLNCDKVYLTSLPAWKDAAGNGGKVLRNFMRECLRGADSYGKKTIAFHTMGTGGYLGYPRDVVASLMYGSVIEFDSSYSKTSIKDVSIVLYNKDPDSIRAFEDYEHMKIHGSYSGSSLSSDFLKGRIKIELVKDDLSKQKVEALLCSVSPDMNLTRSAICKSLVQNGGRSIQDECQQKHSNDLEVGKVVEVSGGSLPCKTIYFTVLPTYSPSNKAEQRMVSVLQTAFQLANLKGYKSMAIPALGTGYLNYPKTTTAKCMYEAVLEWAQKNPKASLRHIKFVMYSKDTEAQQAFRICHLKTQGQEARANRNFIGDGTVNTSQDSNSKYNMIQDGCVLGPVQLNVISGDILDNKSDAIVIGVGNNFDMTGAVAQALVKRCPNILPECQQRKLDLKRDGVVVTSSAGLPSTYIIHVLFQDTLVGWRNKMESCLEEADKKSIKSLAFPILGAGTGPKSFKPESIAECLFSALDDFINKHKMSNLVEVSLVLHPQNMHMKPDIMSALQSKTTEAMSRSRVGRWFQAGMDFLMEKFRPKTSQGIQTPAAKQKAVSELSTIQVQVYSDAIINIDRCIKALEDRINFEYIKKTVDLDQAVVKSLTDKQIDNIIDTGIMIDVKFDKKAGKFLLSGPQKHVLAAVDVIYNRLRQYEREKLNKARAETLYNQVQWHFEECTAAEMKEVPYEVMPSFMIETAYMEGKATVELMDTLGITYVIDFDKLLEYPKGNRSDTVRVIRKDILKGLHKNIPTQWNSMSNNENVKRVALATNDQEFKKVEKMFVNQVQTGPYSAKVKNKQNLQVVKIERIQNRTLYQQYAAKKKLMEQQNPKATLERQVWHGTVEANISSIISNGFNRSYCGVHGVNHGCGVYFARDASYSAQTYLTGSQQGSKKHMFLVKALTGEMVKGTPTMRVLPPVDPSQPLVQYDCAVDDVNNPMEFVIFNDTQAYPEYLITFTL